MFLSDERPTLETLDFAFYIGIAPTFYISICIWTLPSQHTMFIKLLIRLKVTISQIFISFQFVNSKI